MDSSLLEFLLARAKKGVTADGINPVFGQRLQTALQAAEQATGSRAQINDLVRPAARQAQYYANYTQRPVTWDDRVYQPQQQGGLAAPPGRSRHQVGQGGDIARGPVLDWLHSHAPDYGLEFLPGRAFRKDPVHIQLARNWKGDLPQAAPAAQQMTQAIPPMPEPKPPNPSQLNATAATPAPPPDPQAQAAQTAQMASAQAAQQAQQAQQPVQKPVDPLTSLFDSIFTLQKRKEGQKPTIVEQFAESQGAPEGSVGLIGKLLKGFGQMAGGPAQPMPQAEDTAANVPREDAATAMQRGQMAQAMVQPQQQPPSPDLSQPDPNAPVPDLQNLAGLSPEQVEELKRKGLGGLLGLA